MKKRRKFKAEEKFDAVKRVLSGAKKVSDICDEFDIHPNQYYKWQASFFENALTGFQESARGRTKAAEERKIKQLESELRKKDEIIAKIVTENIELKKNDY
jgi:transposase-like protein